MKTFINSIQTTFLRPNNEPQTVCNYADNYYGDQVCHLVNSEPQETEFEKEEYRGRWE